MTEEERDEMMKSNWKAQMAAFGYGPDGLALPQKETSGWISVKDRLPETNDEVLTTYLYDNEPGKRYVETASYFDDGEGEGHWHSVWDEFSIGRVRKTTIA